MPCWVVPAVAAEFWGVSVEQVMADVDAGRVGTCTERDVLFVDVASALDAYPGSAQASAHAPAQQAPRPACRRSLAWTVAGAQTVVTPAERDALLTLDESGASDAATAVESATEWECPRVSHPGDGDDEQQHDVPESVHDEGEPAPLPDGPEECGAGAGGGGAPAVGNRAVAGVADEEASAARERRGVRKFPRLSDGMRN